MKKKYKEVIEIEECKQAVMLARVSSRKQERGASLEAQVEAIQSYCKRNNLIIIVVRRRSRPAEHGQQSGRRSDHSV